MPCPNFIAGEITKRIQYKKAFNSKRNSHLQTIFWQEKLKIENAFIMAKYSEKASDKVGKAMHEMKEGKLKSSSGKKVTSKKQAVAIGLSEARQEGAKVPKKKK